MDNTQRSDRTWTMPSAALDMRPNRYGRRRGGGCLPRGTSGRGVACSACSPPQAKVAHVRELSSSRTEKRVTLGGS
eukprot:1310041-Rhodomonas_salina.1